MAINTSRREFLSAGLMLPVAGAASKINFLDSGDKLTTAQPRTPVKLTQRTLGQTGLKVTSVGFGCMITSDPSVIERAADIGINYFDTARGYQHGNNERMVGAALGAKRKNLILSTKSPTDNKEGLLKDLDTSLAELKTDYVDIWYLHAKDTPAAIHDDMIEAQQIAKQQGKIRFAGMSTHALPKMTQWTIDKMAFDVVLTVYNFTMDQKMDEAIAAVAKTGTGVVAMKIMAGGTRAHRPGEPVDPRTQREGAMLAALKWVLKQPHIGTTIPSMTDMDQLDENLRAMSESFSTADEKILAGRLEQIKPLYCRFCGECDGACQKGLQVADTLRILTYADGYGQFALARERFNELPSRHAKVRCGDCTECTVQCPHGVRVSERMSRAQELFA
ncbi:aldo/keto reductase [Telmatobacter sp. DSM 110680]|uniref:Aldo/keto reductase n=1 Tax=Telmatobacter sp. DSM 110680 TaxID=3036704 RepID=A0AAU7DRQ2_9BACT